MMKYFYIIFLSALIVLAPLSSQALNATPSKNSGSSPDTVDTSSSSPGFGKGMDIISFLVGPSMGSVCGYLKLPPKLGVICAKILECVVDIAMEELGPSKKRQETPDSRSDCGFKQCYAAVVGAKKIKDANNLSADQKQGAQSQISQTIAGCSALCNNLPANSKAQKICGLSDCYDDAVKLLSNPNYEFPEYCCSIVSGKWGGNLGKAIDTFCKGTSSVNDIVCTAQWAASKTLSGECCTGIEDLKANLSSPERAVAYCKNAPAIQDCTIHWEAQKAGCDYARSKNMPCKEVPNSACCILIAERDSNADLSSILTDIGISGNKDTYKEQCGTVPDYTTMLEGLKPDDAE